MIKNTNLLVADYDGQLLSKTLTAITKHLLCEKFMELSMYTYRRQSKTIRITKNLKGRMGFQKDLQT